MDSCCTKLNFYKNTLKAKFYILYVFSLLHTESYCSFKVTRSDFWVTTQSNTVINPTKKIKHYKCIRKRFQMGFISLRSELPRQRNHAMPHSKKDRITCHKGLFWQYHAGILKIAQSKLKTRQIGSEIEFKVPTLNKNFTVLNVIENYVHKTKLSRMLVPDESCNI